jgi:hypothetical protein
LQRILQAEGISPGDLNVIRPRIMIVSLVLTCALAPEAIRAQQPQRIDLNGDSERQVIVDKKAGQYLGHPTTVLLEDGKTILCVYPEGHGRGGIVLKRSVDAGLTWSERQPVPPNWSTSLETPTIHRVIDAAGKKRLIVWSGLYPARLSVSEDDGESWTPLTPVGDWGGIVVMGSLIDVQGSPGEYVAYFHDDGRYIASEARSKGIFTLYQSRTKDGGLTWSTPREIFQSSEIHLCEPGVIRSPDGKMQAMLLRENRRVKNSHVMFSTDEGKTWSTPRELPSSLTGDRHTGKYSPDGRLLISFRDMHKESPFYGDWVAWVGAFDDLVQSKPGDYVVRLKDNLVRTDCAYPGVEALADGTFVLTTYGHWTAKESPYILSVRLKLEELR